MKQTQSTEGGDVFVAIDGNLRLFRYNSACKHSSGLPKQSILIRDVPEDILKLVSRFWA